MTKAARRWLAAGSTAAFVVLSAPTPAAADAVSPAGRCVGTATWKNGGFTKVSTGLNQDDVIEVPRKDEVQWSGKVVGPAPGQPRDIDGRIALQLPPLLGSIPVDEWTGLSTAVEKTGSYAYDLPGIVPAGVVIKLRARHAEAGAEHCTAAVGLVIAGGPFDSPLIWAALASLLLATAALLLLGRRPGGGTGFGRAAGGAVIGLLVGLFGGLSLILFGAIPLASPIVTVLLGAGLAFGGVWAKWAPLGASATAPASTPPGWSGPGR